MQQQQQTAVNELIRSADALASHSLDLARRELTALPDQVSTCAQLEFLYLEGNHLSSLPHSFFLSCPLLSWLDLRNNHLTQLPPSIDNLRCLKTLLLQGNDLTFLPPQLGRLTHLTGLNISCNPLLSPPPPVVRRGTRAVLSYLQEQLAKEGERVQEEEEEEEEDEEEEEEEEGDLQRIRISHYQRKSTAAAKPTATDHTHSLQSLSTSLQLLHKPAHLHPPPSPSPSPSLREGAGGGGGQRSKPPERRRRQRRREGGSHVHAQPLTEQEKFEVSTIIDRQKSVQYLEQWQSEARGGHLKENVVHLEYSGAVDMAPFATEPVTTYTTRKDEDHTLRTTTPHSQLRETREQELKGRVEQYTRTLRGQRSQAKLLPSVSDELLTAERNLAEALAKREMMEKRIAREYRLTAFTPDTHLF